MSGTPHLETAFHTQTHTMAAVHPRSNGAPDASDIDGGEEEEEEEEEGGPSAAAENEEDEEEEEDKGRMLGFMFGNVDDSGDLDEEYMDQDAKEHLSALATQLGTSLFDLELGKGKQAGLSGIGEEDYDTKADDAVDFEDIDEQYEGPEVQIPPEDQQFYAQTALARDSILATSTSEENYDEEEELEKEAKSSPHQKNEAEKTEPETSIVVSMEVEEVPDTINSKEVLDEVDGYDDMEGVEDSDDEGLLSDGTDEDNGEIELPVLCEVDGQEVLRFSELFGVKEPSWILGNRRIWSKRTSFRDVGGNIVSEEDDWDTLKNRPVRASAVLCAAETGSDDESATDESDQEICRVKDSVHGRGEGKRRVKFVPDLCMKDGWNDIQSCNKCEIQANYDQIHQSEWEKFILWDKQPFPIFKCEGEEDEKSPSCSNAYEEQAEFKAMPIEEDILESNTGKQCSFHEYNNGLNILVESLGHSYSEKVESNTGFCSHPQMLRLSACRFENNASQEACLSQKANGVICQLDKLNLKSTQKNNELFSGSWLENIIWDPQELEHSACRSKIIFDFQDSQMVFEIPDNKEGQGLRARAASMVLTAQGKVGASETWESVNHPSSVARFNISNDKYYTVKKVLQQQKSHSKKRAVHGIKVMHSIPALKLQTMKPKLSNKDLANFHRPRAVWFPHHNEVAAKEQGILADRGPMKVILKTLGGKNSKIHVDASETLEAFKAKVAKKLGDVKASEKTKVLYAGKELEDGRTFAEQKVPPNSVLHLVRMKVHPWPRAQRLPGENKPTKPPGAFRKKSELSVKDGHVALMEYCEERPLLLSNVGMGARLSTYYRKMTPMDATISTLRSERGSWLGVTIPLEPTEESPFLGNIRPGETQSCLETNLYRAPVFPHKVGTTDFLLVRSAKGKISLRRIDSIHVVGQQEPHMDVIAPSSKVVLTYLGNRLLAYVYREFRAYNKPGSSPRMRADELMAQFPALSEGFVRKRLKHCADLQREETRGDLCWVMRKNFRIPSEDEIRRMVTPENVCSYESMQAGLHHLKRMGVHKLTQPSGISAAMNQLPDEAITLAAATHIERELQLTPWNLSSNFVSATMQGRGWLERLEITGPGDPSGRGLGFSYLRVPIRPPTTGAVVQKKAAVARGGGAVTGTDADLRRLSMDAAREVLLKFRVPETQIEKLTRWHRIALVRKLSSEHAASGVKVGVAALTKFARGQRMSYLQLQQQAREKCQEIWDRQVQSLSAADDEESDNEDASGDLDTFAGDLENLLEAEEIDVGDDSSKRAKKEIVRGLGARRRALEAQKEEDLEDEAAEAAELHRMLMEDDEPEEDKKKKGVPPSAEAQESRDHQPKIGQPKRKFLKVKRRIDGKLETIIIKDPVEVARYLEKSKAKLNKPNTSNGTGEGKEMKSWLPKKDNKQIGIGKDLAKSKLSKFSKDTSKAGKDGLQVICGACGQIGHMRTNKKKCLMYREDAVSNINANAHRNILAVEAFRQPIPKITIKKKIPDDPQKKKEEVQTVVPKIKIKKTDPNPSKITSFRIKIPTNPDMSVKVNKNIEQPRKEEAHVEVHKELKVNAASSSIIKKIKIKTRKLETSVKNEEPVEESRGEIKGHFLGAAAINQSDSQVLSVKEEYQRESSWERNGVQGMEHQEREEWQWDSRPEMDRNDRVDSFVETRQEFLVENKLQWVRDKQRLREEKMARRREREEEERRKEEEYEQHLHALRLQEERERWKAEEESKQRDQRRFDYLEQEVVGEFSKSSRHRGILITGPSKKTYDDTQLLESQSQSAMKRRSQNQMDLGGNNSSHSKRQRKRGGGEVELSNILESITEDLKKADIHFLFQRPVTKKEAPDYRLYVTHPMDLSTIRDNVRKLTYKSRSDFRKDVQQIAVNAHLYNEGRHPGIPPLADQLLELCDSLLAEKHTELSAAESLLDIDEFGHRVPPKSVDRRSSRTH